MNNYPFLSALALARSFIRDLPALAQQPNTPLHALVQAELASDKKDVVRALQEQRVLDAAHRAYASDAFRSGVEAVVRPALTPLLDELSAQWAGVLRGEVKLRATFSGKKLRHLPQRVLDAFCVTPEETRLLLSALLDDPIMVALWVESQRQHAQTSKEGLLKYAVSNSTFVDRTGVFGRTATVVGNDGKPRVVFVNDKTTSLTTEVDGEEVDFSETLPAPEQHPEDDLDLERDLFEVARAQFGLHQRHGSVFGDLYDTLRENTDFTRDIRCGKRAKVTSKARLRDLAGQHALSVREVEQVATALLRAVQAATPPPNVAWDEETEGEVQPSVSSFEFASVYRRVCIRAA